MSDYTPRTRTYGHGSITLTHYPSSQRIAVDQTGENAVMDASDLYRFMEEVGLLAEVERAAAEKAWDRGCASGYREAHTNVTERNPYRKAVQS